MASPVSLVNENNDPRSLRFMDGEGSSGNWASLNPFMVLGDESLATDTSLKVIQAKTQVKETKSMMEAEQADVPNAPNLVNRRIEDFNDSLVAVQPFVHQGSRSQPNHRGYWSGMVVNEDIPQTFRHREWKD